MQYSQKYNLVSFLEPVSVGTEFAMADWPLHITVADVFAVDLGTGVEGELGSMLSGISPIVLVAGDDAVLGVTQVVLIEKNHQLQDLHEQVISLLELYGAKLNVPEFTRSGFLPHSTVQKSGQLRKGDKIKVDTVSLVDMFPGGDWRRRRVLTNFSLNKFKAW